MKYFIDFEALQFSGEIISIGCIDENGREFYSLVRPKQIKKLTEFITDLTGITSEDLENAPDAEEVFSEFYNWLDTDRKTAFFCYGNNDAVFVARTLRKIKNFYAQCALSLVKANLSDYSIDISKHFGIKQSIALKKLVEYYRNEEITQKHNALDDARFLKEVYEKSSAEEPMECPFPEYMHKPKDTSKDKEAAKKTPVCKKKHRVSATKNNQTITFRSIGRATNWVMNCVMNNKSSLTEESKKRICSKIKKAAEKNTNYCSYTWSITEPE